MIKTTGLEFKRFYKEAFSGTAYHEDEELWIGDKLSEDWNAERMDDSVKITLKNGVFFASEKDQDGISLESHFKRWRRSQSFDLILCEIPKKNRGYFIDCVKSAKGKVIGGGQ